MDVNLDAGVTRSVHVVGVGRGAWGVGRRGSRVADVNVVTTLLVLVCRAAARPCSYSVDHTEGLPPVSPPPPPTHTRRSPYAGH